MRQLRPSASSIWTQCALAPTFWESIGPQPDTDPAREGTCAAWMAEMVLNGEYETCDDMLGMSHENGWLIEKQMVIDIQGYVDCVRRHGDHVTAERLVRLNPMIAGTPDCWAILTKEGGLYVIDLKYGYGVVEPYQNTQVAIYAGAIYRNVKATTQIKKIVIGIYQPRARHPDGIFRTHEYWPEQLMEFVRWIEARGHDCQSIDAIATPGSHCEHCHAVGCVAVTHTAYKAFRVLSDERYDDLSGGDLAKELDFIETAEKILKARKTQLVSEAEARLRKRQFVPFYGFQERLGNSKFKHDADIIHAMTGVDPRVTETLCTPAELIRRGADADQVKRLSERPKIPPKLVRLPKDHYAKLFAKGTN